MSAYYPDEAPIRDRPSRRSHYRDDRRDDRDPRYVDTRDNYLNVHSRDLVPRPREDSELSSVEEIHRDFPPPGYNSRDIRRARSVGPYDDYDDRRSYYSRDDRDYDRRSKKSGSVYRDGETKGRARVISKQEQIIAAVAGAAVAIGGKEFYDRREAKQEGSDIHRNPLASAALGAAGALAGYQGTEFYNKHQKKSGALAHRGRDGYHSDGDDPDEKKGHKNFLESALAAAGLGGAVKALTGGSGNDDKKSDTRSRRGSGSPTPSKSRGEGGASGANKVQKAAMASLIAGATEAFRVSKEPGAWKGEKAKRVFTAAAGAATIDAAQNPDKSNKLALAESVIGGLVGNRVIHGSKKNIEEDKATGRSRSRSRAAKSEGGGPGGASGLAALATAGLGAFGAKKFMDNRDERSSSRRRSADSYDSRGSSPDRRQRRSRSRSVVDTARRSLAKIGIGHGPDDDDDERDRHHRRHQDDYDEPRGSRRHGRHDSDDGYDDYSRGGHGRDRGGRDYDDDRHGGRERNRSRGGGGRRDHSRGGSLSESDLGDSDEDEKRAKKMRGKQILTTGLAAVATIHAAHNVYQSMEKRNVRQKAVKEGRLSPEEAKKLKSKALLQDAASVGIAAIGIKSAVSELKEAREKSNECREWNHEKEARRQKRLERQRRLEGSESYERGRNNSNYVRRWVDDASSAPPPRVEWYDDGPRYSDGNPYSSLPAPPTGYSDRR